MKLTFGTGALALALLLRGTCSAPGAENPSPATNRPLNLTSQPTGQLSRAEWEKRREQRRSLPPEEREAKMKEWRNWANKASLTPEERATKRKEFRERMAKQIEALRQKKQEGRLSAEQERRLTLLEDMLSRTETGTNQPAKLPRLPDDPAKKRPAVISTNQSMP